MTEQTIFEAGDVTLQSGVVLPNVQLVYRTHGQLNAARDNAILYPTHYLGTHDSNAWAIAPGSCASSRRCGATWPAAA